MKLSRCVPSSLSLCASLLRPVTRLTPARAIHTSHTSHHNAAPAQAQPALANGQSANSPLRSTVIVKEKLQPKMSIKFSLPDSAGHTHMKARERQTAEERRGEERQRGGGS